MTTVQDPRTLSDNPARGWVAIVRDDDPSFYIGFDLTVSESHGSEVQVTDHAVEDGTDVVDNIRPKPTGFGCVVYVSNTPVVPGGLFNQLNGSLVLPGGTTPANTPGIIGANDIPIKMPPQALAQPPGAPLFTPGGLFQAAGKGIAAVAGALGLGGDTPITQFTPLQFIGGVFDAVKNTHEALLALQTAATTCTVFTSIKEYSHMVLTHVGMPRDHYGGAEISLEFQHVNFVSTGLTAAPQPTVPAGKPIIRMGKTSVSPAGEPAPLAKGYVDPNFYGNPQNTQVDPNFYGNPDTTTQVDSNFYGNPQKPDNVNTKDFPEYGGDG